MNLASLKINGYFFDILCQTRVEGLKRVALAYACSEDELRGYLRSKVVEANLHLESSARVVDFLIMSLDLGSELERDFKWAVSRALDYTLVSYVNVEGKDPIYSEVAKY